MDAKQAYTGRTQRRFSTAEQVKGFKPEAKVYEVTDSLARGLILRVHPTGTRAWFYRYREPRIEGQQGKLHRIAIGEFPAVTLDDARTARHEWAALKGNAGAPDPHERLDAQRREKAVQKAQEAAQLDTDAWTVRKLGTDFLAALTREGKRPRTIDGVRWHLQKDVYPVIGEIPAALVTHEDVREILHRIEKRGALRLRNAVRVTVRWLYAWATEDGPKHLRHHPNPVATIRRKKEFDRSQRERRAFTETELKALGPRLEAHQGDMYADAISLALLCGTRAEETVSARWENVDLEAGTWIVPETVTKSKRRHTVYLSDSAIAMLRARKVDGSEWVFPLPRSKKVGHARRDTLSKKLTEHLAALGLDTAMTVHECRHTVCTFVEKRWGAGVRQRVANHAQEGLSRVYNHASYDEEAETAWKEWGDYLSALCATGGVVVTMEARGRG
jgi:integrase